MPTAQTLSRRDQPSFRTPSVSEGLLGALLSLAFATLAAAQAPAFEVVSIKPSAPQPMGQMRVGMGGDDGRVTFSNVSLKDMVVRAFDVKNFQVAGPPVIESERFDVNAKIPDGVKRDQVPAMLRAMLAERFKLETHRETRELPVYEMLVAKGGPNLEKSEVENRTQVAMEGTESGMKMNVSNAPVANFCDMLSRMVSRPVLDKTGLQGSYNFVLNLAPEDMPGRGGGMIRMGPGAGGPESGPAPEAGPTGSMTTSLQKLGLKLESKKAPIDMIVVDKIEKVPTEN